jgi:purine-cytosine permease-like protein
MYAVKSGIPNVPSGNLYRKCEGQIMELTSREYWTALHGMVLGALYLLAFSAGLAGLWGLRAEWLTSDGVKKHSRQLTIGSSAMAILGWLTVLLGTYMIYPWYRAKVPAGGALADFPKYLLLSKPQTKEWHEFGMEWKEHIAWLCPILATAVAYVVARYGRQLANDKKLRQALLLLLTVSFFCAAVAGLFGALINKAAPTK